MERVHFPLLATPVPAGFPSPADDYVEARIDLHHHLGPNREATFLMRVEGRSMEGFGIHDGDLLVVDRSLDPVDGSVVIAVIDGAFAVKQLRRDAHGLRLCAAHHDYPDLIPQAGQSVVVWGVVRWSLHRVLPCPASL